MAKDVSDEIARLEEQLEKLRAAQLDSLREKLTAARKVVIDLEAQIAATAGKPASTGRRTRTNPAEVRRLRWEALLCRAFRRGFFRPRPSQAPPSHHFSLRARRNHSQLDYLAALTLGR